MVWSPPPPPRRPELPYAKSQGGGCSSSTSDGSGEEEKPPSPEAIRRASHRCPVIKRIHELLNEHKPKQVKYALQGLIHELKDMPEADATVQVLERLLKIRRLGE